MNTESLRGGEAMTLKQLNELRDMHFHIKRLKRRISEMESAVYPQSVRTDKIVTSGGAPSNAIERTVENTERYKSELMNLKAEYESRVREVESEIYALEDEHIKAILLSRFADAHSWARVASDLGGNNTAESVRKACVRYFIQNAQ